MNKMGNIIRVNAFGHYIKPKTSQWFYVIIGVAVLLGVVAVYRLFKNNKTVPNESLPLPPIGIATVGLEVHPKETTGELEVTIYADARQSFTLVITNAFNQVVQAEVLTSHHVQRDIRHLLPGKYSVMVIDEVTKQSAAAVMFEKKSV